jgi:LEA14-like dessication related protein
MKILLSILTICVVIFSSCGGKNVQEPEYRDIRNIRLINLGPLQSTAGVDFIYYNPNNFGVQVTTARGDIYIDSSFFGQFELSDKVQVKKRSEFTLPTLVKIDMISVIKNQRDIFKKKEALVRIEGTATIKKVGFSRDVPIKYENMQDIEKFKTLLSN